VKLLSLVLQKALIHSEDTVNEHILKVIAPHMDKLNYISFGQKLHTKLLITYPKLLGFIQDFKNANMNKSSILNNIINNNANQTNRLFNNPTNLCNVFLFINLRIPKSTKKRSYFQIQKKIRILIIEISEIKMISFLQVIFSNQILLQLSL